MLAALRDARFLSAARARAYATILFVGMGAALAYGYVSLALGHHPWGQSSGAPGRPGASDFLAFWTAGRLALQGSAQSAYDLTRLNVEEHATAVLPPNAVLAFFYPPTFLLLCLPFAALPYLAGFAAFVGTQTVVLVACLRRILPAGWGYLPVLAFPGLLMNAATGQNGFVSAACFAGALLLLGRRPVVAGACLGLLIVKPHLALAVPVALLVARRWSALAACGLSAASLALLAWAVLGGAAWTAFFDATPAIRAALEQHAEDWGKLQSLFTTARLLGAPLPLAYLAQAALAAGVLVALACACARRPGAAGEVALMAAAAMLCTPHLLDYDLAVTGVPLAWLAREAAERGWRPWEKLIGAVVFVWPMIGRVLTQSYGVAVAPILLFLLFAVVWRRVRSLPGTAPVLAGQQR